MEYSNSCKSCIEPNYGMRQSFVAQSPQQPAVPQTPTGVPLGPAPIGQVQPVMPGIPPSGQTPQTMQSTLFTPGFLRTQIGKRVSIEFLIGTTGPLVDRTGTLLAVGASYVLINPQNTDDLLMCEIYSIKFVTIYR